MSLTLDEVLQRLDYAASGDLVRKGDSLAELPPSRRHAWSSAQDHLGVDAAYFEGRTPLVYFAGVNLPTSAEIEQAIATIHQRTWNESRAQLLVVVLSTEVRVLDGRAAPQGSVPVASTSELGDDLEPFTRTSLLRGRTADVLSSSRRGKTVVRQLREDVRPARVSLIRSGLTQEIADRLLARCLFAQYIDARSLMPHDAMAGQGGFVGCLNRSTSETYELFERLHHQFNGDTFIVDDKERTVVTASHLHVVADLLSGTAGTGQLTLVPRYDFRSIPAAVLGGVYEEFLVSVQRAHAAFYTPGHLVDAALDEVMPPHVQLSDARVLDPACGSGLFLARALERLLDDLEERIGRPPSGAEMAHVLRTRVSGCDVNDDALRVAALSCYLVLLDRLPDDDIASGWKLPRLVGECLHRGDFFDRLEAFAGPYEIIASNPPWKKATEPAERYLVANSHAAGSKLTLAQAFYWACTERLAPTGRMGLLMPARSLYNRRKSERAFQLEALETTGLDVIVDFAAFRHQLFPDAVAPCALFVVRGPAFGHQQHITFSAPKPGPVSAATGRISIDSERIAQVPRRELRQRPEMLRHMIFGDLRDSRLIDRLCYRATTIAQLEERPPDRRWRVGVGFQVVGGGERNDALSAMPLIRPADLRPFRADTSAPIEASSFHRPRAMELYDAPRVLLGRSPSIDGTLRAAFYDKPAAYSESVLGFVAPPGAAGRTAALALCAFLNSRLARYLLLMTASSWGIERPELKVQDLGRLPVDFLDQRVAVERLASLALVGAAGRVKEALDAIDLELRAFCGLTADEVALVDDRLDVQLPAFYDPLAEVAYGRPTEDAMTSYQIALEHALQASLGFAVTAAVELSGEDVVVTVGLDGSPPRYPAALATHSRLTVPSATLIMRRTQRTYGENWIQLLKPAERKQTTRAAALRDSDEIVSELLRAATRRARPTTGTPDD